MKKPILVGKSAVVFTLLLTGFLLPLISYSQTFFGVASSPADNGSNTATTATITPPASMQAGDLVIIYGEYRNTGGTLTISDDGGQSWTTETQYNGSNQRIRIFWCRFNGTWSSNPQISRGAGGGTRPLSAIMYVFRPTISTNSWVVNVGPNNANPTGTSISVTGVTTTLPKTVTMAYWGSPAATTWGSLSGSGWVKTGLTAQYRNTGGSGQSHTSAYNIQSSTATLANVSQIQSSSQQTATSIISWAEIVPPPSNDDCSGAPTLTSGTTCSNTAGTAYGASNSSPTISSPNCASTATYDVWYRFVAQTTNPTIRLSSIGSEFTNASVQLLSNNCGGTFTSLFCGGSTLPTDFLVPGTTYYIRVYSDGGTAPTNSANANFNICIQDPVITPDNDECTGAYNLSVANACQTVPGNMAGATASSQPLSGSCPGSLAYDVWYRFTAINNTATVTISSFGTNFLATRGVEIFSGSCGSLTSLACGSTTATSNSLTAGNVYYVRVYSSTGPAPTGDARFNICVTSTAAPVVRYGNSYVNLSKKTNGGVVQPGDTLEIRMAIQHNSTTNMSRLRFVDNVPTNTAMLTGASDRIRIVTNEGLTYKQYTLASGDDAATYVASPAAGQYNIRMNLGFGTSNPGIPVNNTSTEFASASGTMSRTNRPTLFGSSLLFATAYQVVVTGAVGDTITLNPASFIYYDGSSETTLSGNSYKILISDPLSLCSNSIGINNALESGGTFGSGVLQNRGADLTIPISGYSFLSEVNSYNSVGDGRYAIVKNISPRTRTNKNATFARTGSCTSLYSITDELNCNNRMHNGHWYIDGDHSGTNDALGNPPPDTATNSGYMLMVNADYVASEVYSQTINNLCPNTYYEFSAWVRNICPTCGADSTGAQFAGTPTAPTNGYPGVLPNLTFSLGGLDYYSTGTIDTLGWVKKGFVFRTGPSQTSASFSIRNNAQGGGGNDWVMDDIAVATCFPDMIYSPSSNPNICESNAITITDTVRSYFNDYVEYKWQVSTNGGSTWTDISGTTGTASPTLVGGFYEYVSSYTIPPSNTTAANAGDMYRLVVASTNSNLGTTECSYSDPTTITVSILTDCGPPLAVDLLSISGTLGIDNRSTIRWVTSHEDEPVHYVLQRSNDGSGFTDIATIAGQNSEIAEQNHYSYNDPVTVVNKVFYRIKIVSASGSIKYSKTIRLETTAAGFTFGTVVIPFGDELNFSIQSNEEGLVHVQLVDMNGKTVRLATYQVYNGTNALGLTGTNSLPSGVYLLKATRNNHSIIKTVLKK
ncbi:MAG: T9SS type A sorting domain-containing protein [Chitinophagaceae bacterium]|nr:T9SS type A sorting domain-containing protein [Chitinophagaceae bacterium]